jgi:hypothetical protein
MCAPNLVGVLVAAPKEQAARFDEIPPNANMFAESLHQAGISFSLATDEITEDDFVSVVDNKHFCCPPAR